MLRISSPDYLLVISERYKHLCYWNFVEFVEFGNMCFYHKFETEILVTKDVSNYITFYIENVANMFCFVNNDTQEILFISLSMIFNFQRSVFLSLGNIQEDGTNMIYKTKQYTLITGFYIDIYSDTYSQIVHRSDSLNTI